MGRRSTFNKPTVSKKPARKKKVSTTRSPCSAGMYSNWLNVCAYTKKKWVVCLSASGRACDAPVLGSLGFWWGRRRWIRPCGRLSPPGLTKGERRTRNSDRCRSPSRCCPDPQSASLTSSTGKPFSVHFFLQKIQKSLKNLFLLHKI